MVTKKFDLSNHIMEFTFVHCSIIEPLDAIISNYLLIPGYKIVQFLNQYSMFLPIQFGYIEPLHTKY